MKVRLRFPVNAPRFLRRFVLIAGGHPVAGPACRLSIESGSANLNRLNATTLPHLSLSPVPASSESKDSPADMRVFETLQGEVNCFVPLLESLATEAQEGYAGKPWGGVEQGGLLLGMNAAQSVTILDHVQLECEHAFGPSFELTENDRINCAAQIERLVASNGLEIIGWYRTTSKCVALTDEDAAFSGEFFATPGQVTLLIQRGRNRKPGFTVFRRDHSGELQSAVTFIQDEGPKRLTSGRPVITAPPLELVTSNKLDTSGMLVPSGDAWKRFHLKQDPFDAKLDPALWYSSKSHRETAASILEAIQMRKGCMVLTGAPGVGKTLLLEYVASKLKLYEIDYALLLNSVITVDDFFAQLSTDLKLPVQTPNKLQVLIALQDRLLSVAEKGSTVTVMIDDAHRLPLDVLEEIDLLGNFESGRRILQWILGGELGFEQRLRKSGLHSIRRRLGLHTTLLPLQPEEVSGYIQTRLRSAGAESDMGFLSESVAQAIGGKTGGIPRSVNQLAAALLSRLHSLDESMDLSLVDQAAEFADATNSDIALSTKATTA